MSDPRAFLELDRLVHEPARLAILSVLAPLDRAEFKFVERLTGLTKGNLSAQAQKLEAAGYIQVHKGYRGRVPLTEFSLSEAGRRALSEYWSLVERLKPADT
jgi:DNA-binding MarR family transcriptional regulator